MSQDFWSILGVEENCPSSDRVKNAYIDLVNRHRLDKHPGKELEHFRLSVRIHEAYLKWTSLEVLNKVENETRASTSTGAPPATMMPPDYKNEIKVKIEDEDEEDDDDEEDEEEEEEEEEYYYYDYSCRRCGCSCRSSSSSSSRYESRYSFFDPPVSQTRYNDYKTKVSESGSKALIFDPSIDRTATWRGMKPSTCYVNQGISEIRVFPPGSPLDGGPQININSNVKQSILDQYKHLNKCKNVSEDTLRELALSHGVITGKWMLINIGYNEVDRLWKYLVQCLRAGKLPNEVIGLSIYGRDSSNPFNDGTTKIFIITDDFRKSDKIMHIKDWILSRLDRIRSEQFLYKPTIYSLLSITSGNRFKIKTSIYRG